MARSNHVRLSDREVALVEEVRATAFGSDSVPLGEAVAAACEDYLEQIKIDESNV